jgi:hypothetical protein
MTSVPKSQHVKDVFLNPDTGLLAMQKTAGRKILFLELSTIDAAASTEVARAVIDGGFGDFVDAPCSVCIRSFHPDAIRLHRNLGQQLTRKYLIGRRNGGRERQPLIYGWQPK